ncbi:hypothetical protein ACQPZK_07540 [Micromonospora sp. CA-249363]|uniref:hypothetical protein n=1 Tax=Micromonospora sp. CA-249363 TaxID=3239963 RepID=UPI003D8E1E15
MSEQEQTATPDFVEIVSTGTHAEALEALRAHLTARLALASDRDAVGLSKQLTDVIDRLNRLGADEEGSDLDDLLNED